MVVRGAGPAGDLLGPSHRFRLVVVAMICFGFRRLPDMASDLGRGVREFRRAMRDRDDEPEEPSAGAERCTRQARCGAWVWVLRPRPGDHSPSLISV